MKYETLSNGESRLSEECERLIVAGNERYERLTEKLQKRLDLFQENPFYIYEDKK